MINSKTLGTDKEHSSVLESWTKSTATKTQRFGITYIFVTIIFVSYGLCGKSFEAIIMYPLYPIPSFGG
jgi:hypothetical protein